MNYRLAALIALASLGLVACASTSPSFSLPSELKSLERPVPETPLWDREPDWRGRDGGKAWTVMQRGPFDNGVEITAITINGDGSLIYTGDAEGHIREWDASTGLVLRELGKLEMKIGKLALRPDSSALVAAYNIEIDSRPRYESRHLLVFDLRSGEVAADLVGYYGFFGLHPTRNELVLGRRAPYEEAPDRTFNEVQVIDLSAGSPSRRRSCSLSNPSVRIDSG